VRCTSVDGHGVLVGLLTHHVKRLVYLYPMLNVHLNHLG
jgi:hypothetical protein